MSPSPDAQGEPPREETSLDELTAAFAKVMGAAPPGQGEPRQAAAAAGQPGDEQPADGPAIGARPGEPAAAEKPIAEAEPEDERCPLSPRSILEAMLFVGGPEGGRVPPARAAEVMRGVEPGDVAALVDELGRRYAANGCPYYIASDEGGYRMTLRPEHHRLRSRFYGRIREAHLSQAAIDVLAIVAYQQPLTADDVSRLRSKPSGHVLSQLVRRRLLRIERKGDGRRTAHYHTTDRFLRLFGIGSLDELPQSEELDRP